MTEPLPTQAPPAAPGEDSEGEVRGLSTITIIDTQSFHHGEVRSKPTSDTGISTLSATSSARYVVRKELGTGGFGTVSLAWDTTLQREVAIKRPAAHLNAELKQTFLAEARLAAKVKHPGIVVVHDVGLDEVGDPFVVYEYLTGTNLKQRLSSQAYPLPEALQLALSLAEALAAAHQQGLTHRDLKPANILIDDQGRPHIADFGLATEHEQQESLRGQVAGTNRYMSPEQVRGEAHQLDGRTDLWSLGVIMYEMLTGKTPFPGRQQEEVFDQILTREPRPPRQWINTIPKPVEQVVLKLLAKSIALRYSSATDVVDDLRACLQASAPASPTLGAGSENHLTRNTIETEQSPPFFTAHWWKFAGSTIAIMALSVLTGAWLNNWWGNAAGFPAPVPAVGATPKPGNPAPTLSQPPTDKDFGVDKWTQLLRQEPWPILFSADDRLVFPPAGGELWVKAEYPTLLQLGETQATDYSIRLTIQPDEWDGDVGLFLGYSPSRKAEDVDQAALFGVSQLNDKGVTLSPRTMEFQRQGNQYPISSFQPARGQPELPMPKSGKAMIQIDVHKGFVAALFMDSHQIKFSDFSAIANFPTKGKFGIYVFGRTSSFSKAEVRITTRSSIP